MGIFNWLMAAAVGLFATKSRGRGRLGWAGLTLLLLSLGEVCSQIDGGSNVGWASLVTVSVMLLLLGLKSLKTAAGAAEAFTCALTKCPYCAETVRTEAVVCKHYGRDIRQTPQV